MIVSTRQLLVYYSKLKILSLKNLEEDRVEENNIAFSKN